MPAMRPPASIAMPANDGPTVTASPEVTWQDAQYCPMMRWPRFSYAVRAESAALPEQASKTKAPKSSKRLLATGLTISTNPPCGIAAGQCWGLVYSSKKR